MARKNKVDMPMSGAGLTRYFDDYKSSITIQPLHVIILAALVMIFVLVLHIIG